jgi:vacuolar-type H+-ATPase subunit H
MAAKLEDLGRTIDREIKRIADYLENEVRPAAQEGSVKFLRKAATELEALAQKIEEARKSAESKKDKPTTAGPAATQS